MHADPFTLVSNTTDPQLKQIGEKILRKERISFDDGVALFEKGSLSWLGALANWVREEKHGNKLIGTANFVSLNVHKGIEPSRRDDLESCIYVLLYMFQYEIQQTSNIVQNKEQLTTDESIPVFIKDMLTYVRNLEFKETPNYEYLINILNK